jgi:hypothetical protein
MGKEEGMKKPIAWQLNLEQWKVNINRINVHQLPSTLLFRSIGPWVLPSTR